LPTDKQFFCQTANFQDGPQAAKTLIFGHFAEKFL